MSTITMNQALEPSFGMLTSGPAFGAAVCPISWPAAGMTTAAADHTYALVRGGVDSASKRRTAKGSPTWRTSDC